jgi:hypothetical protein
MNSTTHGDRTGPVVLAISITVANYEAASRYDVAAYQVAPTGYEFSALLYVSVIGGSLSLARRLPGIHREVPLADLKMETAYFASGICTQFHHIIYQQRNAYAE